MITVMAPAKINLTLEVLAERPDGFHEVRSVIQTIGLYDRLRFQPSKKIAARCNADGWLASESLVSKAAALLKETSGYPEGTTIELTKRIPLLSGLAGDSSDAAAVLLGLNRLWGLKYSSGELAGLAQQLGSDVAFFLSGGTALVQGKGEVVSPLPSLPTTWTVLLIPPMPRSAGKTGRLYASLKPEHYSSGQATEKLVALLTRGGCVTPDNLSNIFESVAYSCFAGLDAWRERFLKAGAASVHLAGSGPTLFTLLRDRAEADRIYGNLKEQGLEAYLAETVGAVSHTE